MRKLLLVIALVVLAALGARVMSQQYGGPGGQGSYNVPLSGNGSAVTNLTYRYTTNPIPALQISWGQAYFTNIGANFTITIAVPSASFFETAVIMVTNSTATDFSVTMPAGVWGAFGSGTPAIAWCSNKLVTEIDLKHYGQQLTNMTATHYAP